MARPKKALTDINKPHYRYWQAIFLSFFKDRLYIDVAKRWHGLGLLYLFMITCLFSLPLGLIVANGFNQYFNRELLNPIQHMPPLTIQNGKLLPTITMPYLVRNDQGEVSLIIDSTGTVRDKDERYPHLRALVTETQLIFWPPSPKYFFAPNIPTQNFHPVVQSFPKQMNEVFDGQRWIKSSVIRTLKFVTLAIIILSLIAIFYVIFLSFFLIFGMIAQLVAKLFYGVELTYPQATRLLIVAATPAIGLLILSIIMGWTYYAFGLFILTVLVIYFSYAVIMLRAEQKKMVHL